MVGGVTDTLEAAEPTALGPALAIDRGRPWSSPAVAILLGGCVVVVMTGFVALAMVTRSVTSDGVAQVSIASTFAVVGLLLALRRRTNPIGWLMLSIAVSVLANTDARVFALHYYHPYVGGLVAPRGAVLIIAALWGLPVMLGTITLLLFPDGTLPSPRWRWVFWMFLALCALIVTTQFVAAVDVIGFPGLTIDRDAGILTTRTGVYGVAEALGSLIFLLIPIWFAWIARFVLSYRRATGERRQQLMWVSAGAAICIVGLLGVIFLNGSSRSQVIVHAAANFLVLALPISMGVAILRYRLYDINRLVSRTVSYALVTGIVAGGYLGLITLTTRVLDISSAVGVAASTLVAVALFNPLRKRVQRLVDRRFNRAHYDADALLTTFVMRLREAVALNDVESDTLAMVQQVFEPQHVGLWVKEVQTEPARVRVAADSAAI